MPRLAEIIHVSIGAVTTEVTRRVMRGSIALAVVKRGAALKVDLSLTISSITRWQGRDAVEGHYIELQRDGCSCSGSPQNQPNRALANFR